MAYQCPEGKDVDSGIDMILKRTKLAMDSWKIMQQEAKKQGLKNSDWWEMKEDLGQIEWTKGGPKITLKMTYNRDWWIYKQTDKVFREHFEPHQYKQCVTRLIQLLKQYDLM